MGRERRFMVKYNYLSSWPTWVMTNAMSPFLPKAHPWKNKWFTLRDWHQNQTPLCRSFDMLGWVIAGQVTGFLLVRILMELVN